MLTSAEHHCPGFSPHHILRAGEASSALPVWEKKSCRELEGPAGKTHRSQQKGSSPFTNADIGNRLSCLLLLLMFSALMVGILSLFLPSVAEQKGEVVIQTVSMLLLSIFKFCKLSNLKNKRLTDFHFGV